MRTTPSSLQLNPMACIGIHSHKQTPIFRIELGALFLALKSCTLFHHLFADLDQSV